MFDIFESVAGVVGFKLVEGFTEKLADYISETIKKSKDGKNRDEGGNYAQIGSSGDSARIGSSGDYARIGSSGDSARIGSSGDSARIEVEGDYSVAFACGRHDIVKAKAGTWISLCEYDDDGKPIFALSAQISNEDYKDGRGKVLSENEWYTLEDKAFWPVDESDGIRVIKKSEKSKGDIKLIGGVNLKGEKVHVAKASIYSAHGRTQKEAMDDLKRKIKADENVLEVVAKIKESGFVTKEDYRAITGACQYGVDEWCKEHGVTEDKVPLEKALELLEDARFGAVKFKQLVTAVEGK